MRLHHIIITVFLFSILEGCTPTSHVAGRYTNIFAEVAGEEYTFVKAPDKFEYYSRTESAVNRYSSGSWTQNKRTIILKGFEDKSINLLNVEMKVDSDVSVNGGKIRLKYKDDPLDLIVKVELIINSTLTIAISGDTFVLADPSIKTVQIKAYLDHKGYLLAGLPRIDTLYSPAIAINPSDNDNMTLLSFEVTQKDFYRIKLLDTLRVKSRYTLGRGNTNFRRIRE